MGLVRLWKITQVIGATTGFLLFSFWCWHTMVTLMPGYDASVMAGTIGNIVTSDGPLRSNEPVAIDAKFQRTLETMSGLTMVQQEVVSCPIGSNATVTFDLPFKDTASYNVVYSLIGGTVSGTWPDDYGFTKTSGSGGTFTHPGSVDTIQVVVLAAGIRK